MNLPDILTTSHCFYMKCAGATNENLNFILGFEGLNYKMKQMYVNGHT